MTQIYKVRLAEKHTVLAPVLGDQAMVKYDPFDGHPKLPIWEPVECCVYKPRKNSTDFASFWMCPVLFSDRSLADTILKRLLKESCEFLPLAMPSMAPIMIHSTKIVDCLDEGSSRIEYGVEDHWIFHSDRLPDRPNLPTRRVSDSRYYHCHRFRSSPRGRLLPMVSQARLHWPTIQAPLAKRVMRDMGGATRRAK